MEHVVGGVSTLHSSWPNPIPERRRSRRRPGRAEWAGILSTLMDDHAAHHALPFHVLDALGARHGLAPRSVETRYSQHIAAELVSTSWQLGPAERAMVAGAVDFEDAYARLRLVPGAPAFPVVDRLLWADVSRALVGLRVAERQRRQELAESPNCDTCEPTAGLAAAA